MSDWHVAYRISDGKMKWAPSALLKNFPNPLPDGVAIKSFLGGGRLDQGTVWNQLTLEYDPAPPPRLISYGEYLSRFTLSERRDMYLSTTAEMSAFFRAIDHEGLIGKTADLDGSFLNGITQLVVNESIITGERKAEILA